VFVKAELKVKSFHKQNSQGLWTHDDVCVCVCVALQSSGVTLEWISGRQKTHAPVALH